MKKKIVLGLLGLFVLLIGITVSLPFIFKDKIIAKIKTEANKNLKAKVDFSKVELTLISSFPNFTLDLYDFSLIGLDEFENDTLASIKTLGITIDIMSIIKGDQIKIVSFLMDQPSILAKVLADGKANWDIALEDSTTPVESEDPTEFKASLNSYEIINGKIVYDDIPGNMYAELIGFNHKGSGDFTQDNFILETITNIDQLTYKSDGVKMLNKVKTTFKADLDMDMKNMKFTFKENEVQLNELFMGFDGWVSMPTDDIDMDITFFAKKTEFKNILSLVPAVYSNDFASVKTSGTLSLDGFVKGKYNETTMPGFGTKLLVENAMFQYPDLPKAVTNININLVVDNKTGVPDHTIVNLKRFYMEMAENPFEMKMLVTTPVSDANIDGVIKGKVLLSSIKDIVPLEQGESMNGTIVADITMKGRMSSIEKEQYDQFNLAGTLMAVDMEYKSNDTPYDVFINKAYLNFSPKFVELSTFESKIGKSDINASGKITHFIEYMFKDETLDGVFAMNSRLMDLNEFMAESETPTASQPTKTPTEQVPMSVIEVPGNINFLFTAAISKMLYDNMEMENVTGSIKIADKMVDMNNLRMNMLGGAMVVNGSYETKDLTKPGIAFSLDIQNFDIQKTVLTFNTVEKLAPVAKNSHGKFSTSMTVKGILDDKMEPVLNTLNGGGKLSTGNVVVTNFEPISKMADALKMEQYKKLALNDVNLSFEFKEGKVVVEPFDIKIGNTNARVGGSTGFDQTINYTWNLDVPRSEFGGAANTALAGLVSQAKAKGANVDLGDRIKVDVLVGGTVTAPTIKVGLKDMADNLASGLKDKAKEELDKKKAELEAKAREEADKLKKNAQDKVNAETDKAKAAAQAEADKAKTEAEAKVKAEADKIKAEADRKKQEAEDKAKEEAKKKLKGLIKP
ncbi:MAG: AsmA family protein [Bacteroidetes bacterium]|nr:AsmA family protein [Bacteroidota bacterium]HET6244366.1 AsmA-like C-terminal region-containing protein [Bacteroidia bacterium]